MNAALFDLAESGDLASCEGVGGCDIVSFLYPRVEVKEDECMR